MIDWLKIKTEYISTRISMRDLAAKHSISYSTLDKRARKERWASERVAHGGKVEANVRQKTAAAIASKEADRFTRHMAAYDQLLDTALDILNLYKDKRTKKDVYTLEKLAAILERVQKGHRLGEAQGAGTDIEDLSPLARLLGDGHE